MGFRVGDLSHIVQSGGTPVPPRRPAPRCLQQGARRSRLLYLCPVMQAASSGDRQDHKRHLPRILGQKRQAWPSRAIPSPNCWEKYSTWTAILHDLILRASCLRIPPREQRHPIRGIAQPAWHVPLPAKSTRDARRIRSLTRRQARCSSRKRANGWEACSSLPEQNVPWPNRGTLSPTSLTRYRTWTAKPTECNTLSAPFSSHTPRTRAPLTKCCSPSLALLLQVTLRSRVRRTPASPWRTTTAPFVS